MSEDKITQGTSSDRTPRAKKSRSSTTRRKPWAPPSMLDAPPAPDGYKHRWIRAETRGFDDRKNISAKLREGWELVRSDEYPDFEAPVIDNGKYEGVFGVGGLLRRFKLPGACGCGARSEELQCNAWRLQSSKLDARTRSSSPSF